MLLYGGYPVTARETADSSPTPSGSAAGSSMEEAVLQGVLELVERDASPSGGTAGSGGRQSRSTPSMMRSYAGWCSGTSGGGGRSGRSISPRTWGFRSSPRCPPGPDGPDALLLGFGAHLDPGVALTRALLELTQIDVQVGRAEEEGRALDPTLAAWLRDATVASQPYLEPAPGSATAQAAARVPLPVPSLATDDIRADIETCQQALARAGIELLVLDQTRPDIGVPVVKVLAPGLRHFRRRFAPGRLYDVPVRLGWLTKARAEAELNPIPFFL